MLVAGEVSGDLQGAMLARSIKELAPEVKMFGMGGPEMKEAGVDIRFDVLRHASIGILENLKNYFITMRIVFHKVKRVIEEEKPSCIVLIDYQGFNLALAKFAKKKGIPLVYYIPPQYWAWRTGRARYVARLMDRIIAVLPDEEKAYRKAGARVAFVGNPLLDRVKVQFNREQLRQILGFRRNAVVIGLLPGSRFSEVKSLLPVMLESAKILMDKIPDSQFVIPVAASYLKEEIEAMVKRSGISVKILEGSTYGILVSSDIAIICSGLATLEAAILGVPMVVVYKVSFLTYIIAKAVLKIPYISPPNILAGKEIVPELLQRKANPPDIANAVFFILKNSEKLENMKKGLSGVVSRLGPPGASLRAAEIVLEVIRS